MIEVADTPAFFENSTAAADKAESENEDIFELIDVPDPQDYENHVVHWNSHFLFMQSREFNDTEGIPEQVRTRFLEHMAGTEFLMYEKAKTSYTFAQELLKNANFPAVFKIGNNNPTIIGLVKLHESAPPPETVNDGATMAPPPAPPPLPLPPGGMPPMGMDPGMMDPSAMAAMGGDAALAQMEEPLPPVDNPIPEMPLSETPDASTMVGPDMSRRKIFRMLGVDKQGRKLIEELSVPAGEMVP